MKALISNKLVKAFSVVSFMLMSLFVMSNASAHGRYGHYMYSGGGGYYRYHHPHYWNYAQPVYYYQAYPNYGYHHHHHHHHHWHQYW